LASPASPTTPESNSSAPAPYAGKFDPKAIAKRAGVNNSSSSALGKDLPLKEITKAFQQHIQSIRVA
jgi:ATP-dependent RNA helicase DDX46/PRP5